MFALSAQTAGTTVLRVSKTAKIQVPASSQAFTAQHCLAESGHVQEVTTTKVANGHKTNKYSDSATGNVKVSNSRQQARTRGASHPNVSECDAAKINQHPVITKEALDEPTSSFAPTLGQHKIDKNAYKNSSSNCGQQRTASLKPEVIAQPLRVVRAIR